MQTFLVFIHEISHSKLAMKLCVVRCLKNTLHTFVELLMYITKSIVVNVFHLVMTTKFKVEGGKH
jgi:hypothetical protein